jgi:hypothetical protein
MFKFKSDHFSEFADLGDLRCYTLEEISSLIKHLKKEERVDGQIYYVTWSNEFYVFVMEYDLNGKFRRIHTESWLDPKLDIIVKLRNSIKYIFNETIQN